MELTIKIRANLVDGFELPEKRKELKRNIEANVLDFIWDHLDDKTACLCEGKDCITCKQKGKPELDNSYDIEIKD